MRKNYSSILGCPHDARREETNLLKAKNTKHHERMESECFPPPQQSTLFPFALFSGK
jgi:hypothetical protein